MKKYARLTILFLALLGFAMIGTQSCGKISHPIENFERRWGKLYQFEPRVAQFVHFTDSTGEVQYDFLYYPQTGEYTYLSKGKIKDSLTMLSANAAILIK